MSLPGQVSSNWPEVQRGMAVKAGLALTAATLPIFYGQFIRGHDLDVRVVLLGLATVITCLVLALSEIASPSLTLFLQIVIPFISVSLTYVGLGYREAALLLPLVVAAAALLLPPALAAGFTAAAIAILVCWPLSIAVSPWLCALLVGGTCILVVSGRRELREALTVAWGQAEQGAALAHDVRLRQQEVNRLNKALQVANGLLKRSFRELSLAQKEAEEARHLKEQFAATVSHELRTPLNVILGFLDVMQRYPQVYGEVGWTPALRRDIAEMQRSAQYLSDLVDDILDLARIQALKMPIHREHTDLHELIHEAADLAARLLRDKEAVALKLDLDSYVPRLYVDRTRIRQVLLNLLANACRFTDVGEIRVSASLCESEVVVSVSDSGPGIPPEQLEVIFDDFRQASTPGFEERTIAGKGLGLAIAKRFVQMHGGRIWAESGLGQGSTFYFSLPVAAKQVINLAPPPTQVLADDGSKRLVVLVDEDDGCEYLARHLEGYDAISAPNLAAARALVRERHPDAVIVNVPPEPEEATQGAPPPILPEAVPVLQCSLPTTRRLPESDLFDDWLVKPIDSSKLLTALARFPHVRRVLIVDDDHSFVRLLRRILEAQGSRYELVWAYEGEEALAKLQEQPVDALLVDIALPGMSGRRLAHAAREAGSSPAPVIIAVTAAQPGEATTNPSRTFAVSFHGGLNEESTLNLIRACLAQLRPAYASEQLAEGLEGNPPELPA
ncbi:MAG: ATP-binding protein [Anaerolineae bacterium]